MSFYEERILPHLVNLAMRNQRLLPYRERVVSAAEGRVLEIGIGSGLNLPFYTSRVREVLGLDPAPRLVTMARRAAPDDQQGVREPLERQRTRAVEDRYPLYAVDRRQDQQL